MKLIVGRLYYEYYFRGKRRMEDGDGQILTSEGNPIFAPTKIWKIKKPYKYDLGVMMARI